MSEQHQPASDEEKPVSEPNRNHWQLLGDVLALQFKLAIDGVRDLLLSPISIVAAIAGIFTHPENPGVHFERVLKFGHKTDKWINLFGAEPESSSDVYVKKVEDFVVNEYNKGGVVKSIKDNTDGLIGRLRKR